MCPQLNSLWGYSEDTGEELIFFVKWREYDVISKGWECRLDVSDVMARVAPERTQIIFLILKFKIVHVKWITELSLINAHCAKAMN